jgi:hypothetical protein
MQYKNATKIIIYKKKLDILIRLGCPDNQILQLLKTGKFTPTGDSLIDETLECLVDFKEFKNWGGNHNPKGINGYNKKKKRGQVDRQVDSQDDCQVVDKDIDIDIEEDKERKNKKLKTEDITDFESLFTYWEQNKKGGKYKPESRQRMLNKLKELTNNDFEYAKKAIFYAIDNNYQGFTDGSRLYYKEKPTQKSLYEKCVENGLKFLEDTDD